MVDTCKKVVIIGFVWPESNSSAAGQNMLGIIKKCLAFDWQVTFLTAAGVSPHADDLSQLNITIKTITLNCDSFNQLIADINPDIVIFDRFMTEEQFSWRVREVCPNAVRILNTEDLHSIRDARQQLVKQSLLCSNLKNNKNSDKHNNQLIPYSMPMSYSEDDSENQQSHSDIAYREIAAIIRSDLSFIISQPEIDTLTNQYQVNSNQLYFLPLMLKNTAFNLTGNTFSQRKNFVWVGNFRHAPNWDAVLQLKAMWPQIRKKLPNAELHVYGAYTPDKATTLHAPKQGFLVKGWAKDINSIMQKARVCIAPLRFGAGIKGKLICAMQNGTPSVTTEVGIEGLANSDAWPGSVANNVNSFTELAVKLYDDEDTWKKSVNKIPSVFEGYFNSNRTHGELFSRLTSLCDDIQAHRQPLFYQHLLWHHSLKSSQYMSQWISSKNRLAELEKLNEEKSDDGRVHSNL